MGSSDEEIRTAMIDCKAARQPENVCADKLAREKPARMVEIIPFFLDVTEVTCAQYASWLKGKRPEERDRYIKLDLKGICIRFDDTSGEYMVARNAQDLPADEHPVTGVTWKGADAFCRARQARLPTEAEWEFASRGSAGDRFPWGASLPGCNEAIHDRKKGQRCSPSDKDLGTAQVKSSSRDRRPYTGIHDLGGNVGEWVADAMDTYSWDDCAPGCTPLPWEERICRDPVKCSEGPSQRVFRGGDWASNAFELRGAARYRESEDGAARNIGFRCAADASPREGTKTCPGR